MNSIPLLSCINPFTPGGLQSLNACYSWGLLGHSLKTDQKPKHACSVEFGVLVHIASKLKLRLRYCSFKGKYNCTNITMLSKVTALNNFMYLRIYGHFCWMSMGSN